jgi:tRNA threonylcarbamoyladenosine biosynthesis protein TsaB
VRVLAIDTSTELCTVAVLADGDLRAELDARVRAKHGEILFRLVDEALELAALDKHELDLLAVGLGPGSFTGTRVGVATAKGLAVALGRPLVGVVTLRAIAAAAPAPLVAPAVDAHKGEVYVALYAHGPDGLRERLAPTHAPPDEAVRQLAERAAGAPLALCGSGVRRYPEAFAALDGRSLAPIWDVPRAAVVARLALARHAARGPDDRAALEPLYVRPSDAKLPSR